MIVFCAHNLKARSFWSVLKLSQFLFMAFNEFLNDLSWVAHFLYFVFSSWPSVPHDTLLLWDFPLKFYLTYWVFHFQHHLSFVFPSILSFNWTWFSHLMLTYAPHSDFAFIFVFVFCLLLLFEHGYNNFEFFVFMIFQVIFIAMKVLIVGGDMLSWVSILFLFLHWHLYLWD